MNTHTPGPFWNVGRDGSVCIGNTHAAEVMRRYEVHADLLGALRLIWKMQGNSPTGEIARAVIDKAEGV